MAKRKISQKDKRSMPSCRMLKHLIERHTAEEIAKQYGVRPSTVWRWRRYYNLGEKALGRKLRAKQEDWPLIAGLRDVGLKWTEIVRKMDDYDPPLSPEAVKMAYQRYKLNVEQKEEVSCG